MAFSGRVWPFVFLLISVLPGRAQSLPDCAKGVKAFSPCELSYEWHESEVPSGLSAYKDDLLNVEFRSPHANTYSIHAFWDGGHTLRVRFTPLQAGTWAYRASSSIKRLDSQEGTFNAAENSFPGFVSVANVRHWWTTNKQPHLWLSASAPLLAMDQSAFDTWADARKHDGFTHIRGTLLTAKAAQKPFAADMQPNFAYFAALDSRVIDVDSRGLTADLLLADDSFLATGVLDKWEQREPLVRYLVARYGSFNVAWQGIEHFEDLPGSRALLKDLGSFLMKYDAYRHPRSTDAHMSATPLLLDGWMDYLVEASPRPELGAVDHQFTEKPTVHVVNAADPEGFRHELWNSTTNGEYPCVSYEATQNEANLKAIRVWHTVMADTRHWELEPYFDVDNARALGLDEVEYLAYTTTPGIVEITLPKHKYSPVWVNPATGDEQPLKDYRGEVFSRQTPDATHDWVLQVPREGHKEMMLRSYRFDSQDPPVQEVELNAAKIPFEIVQPSGVTLDTTKPIPFQIKITRSNRASRTMEFVWYGEVGAEGEGSRVLALGPKGEFTFPKQLIKKTPATLSLRLEAINANGKAYEIDKVFQLLP